MDHKGDDMYTLSTHQTAPKNVTLNDGYIRLFGGDTEEELNLEQRPKGKK